MRTLRFLPLLLPLGFAPLHSETILNTQSPWRVHQTWGDKILATAEEPKIITGPDTPPPDVDWPEPGFNDADWVRGTGPWFSGADDEGAGWGFHAPNNLNLLALRGKFRVDDPAAAGDLVLDLAYRGGVTVFLNGEEVARRHMDQNRARDIQLAVDYPEEVYRADGRTIPPPREWGGSDFTAHVNRRVRTAEIQLPARLLREGLNVLGLRLHPAAYRSDWADYAGDRARWSTPGLMEVELRAENPEGIQPNLLPPEGVTVWSANLLERVGEAVRFPDPLEPALPVRMAAPRNGIAHARVVISTRDDGEVPGYSFTASRLQSEDGAATLPADILKFRYPGPGLLQALTRRESPSAALVTASIPADAAPGRYHGTLTVHLGGLPNRTLPIQLDIAGWTSPDSRDFISVLGMLNSPETVSEHYNVPVWSEAHFEKLTPSIRLLGDLGNDILFIPMIRHTHLSNEETLPRWRRGEDGTYKPDMEVLRRYLKLVDDHMGEPSSVVLYLYEGGKRPVDLHVTGVDSYGNTFGVEAPQYGEEGSPDFWKPAFDGIRGELKELGWPREILHFGVFGDSWAQEPAVKEFFQAVAPEIPWSMFTHARGHPRPEGDRLVIDGWNIGHRVLPNHPDFRRFPDERYFRMGWSQPYFQLSSARGYLSDNAHPAAFHTVMEAMMTTESWRGVSRIGLDFWPVDGSPIIGRHHRWHNLYRSNPRSITEPGPAGAVATIRYEALRVGLQENEASLFLDRALRLHGDDLDPDLKERIRELKRERITRFIIADSSEDTRDEFAGTGWQSRALELYRLAAEVAAAVDLPQEKD